MTKFLTIEQILQINKKLILTFGGDSGVISKSALESAIFRMQSSFDGNNLYPTIFEKAAAAII